MNEPYLVDGENLAVALLHLLELPQEVPARAQAHKPSSKKPHQSNQSNNQRITAWPCHESKALTRTWTWRGPRWWPRASCGRSWGAHRRGSAARDPPPGTDGTARSKPITQKRTSSAATPARENTRWIERRRRRRRRGREAYPVGDHFCNLARPAAAAAARGPKT